VGNITTLGTVRTDFIKYWNAISPETEDAWSAVEPTRDTMNWAKLDAIHTYAVTNGIPFMAHRLIWGSMQPGWLTSLSAADQAAEVTEWIASYCGRYPDVKVVTVVNEPPPHTTPTVMAALGGAGASGYDWIVKAFQIARMYCPNAILMMNDYSNIEYVNQNLTFIGIVNANKAAGAPIDAVGAEAHEAHKVPTATVKSLLEKLATDTGLPVYITEYDINLSDDTAQKSVMMDQFTMFYTHPSVRGITLWGYIFGSTWQQYTGLMSSAGVMRPAMTWLMAYLGRLN
jgi:endo-1,4-beta-xylanase